MDTEEQSKNLNSPVAGAPAAAVDAVAVPSAGVGSPVAGSSVSAGAGQRSGVYVRPFVAEWDYCVFARWLRAHGREVLAVWALPQIGFVACMRTGESALGDGPSDDAVATTPRQKKGSATRLAVAFGYRDGRVGMVTWLTAAPGLSPRVALGACSLVTAAVERELEGRGVRLMISPTERPSLVKFMRRRGWRVAHAANVLLWRELGNAEERGGVRCD